jgi:large subunit ribosomal protein L18
MSRVPIHRKRRSKSRISWKYPVVVVSRSNKHMMAQVVDPVTGNTNMTFSSAQNVSTKGSKIDQASQVGGQVATYLKDQGISQVIFDRNGYRFHGRVEAVAKQLESEGLL